MLQKNDIRERLAKYAAPRRHAVNTAATQAGPGRCWSNCPRTAYPGANSTSGCCTLRPVHPGDRFGNRLRGGQPRTGAAQLKRLVAVADVADRVSLVPIDGRVGVGESKLAAQQLDITRVAGQEQPPWSCAVQSRVLLECTGRVLLRLDGNRVHEDITAHAGNEQLLNLYEV